MGGEQIKQLDASALSGQPLPSGPPRATVSLKAYLLILPPVSSKSSPPVPVGLCQLRELSCSSSRVGPGRGWGETLSFWGAKEQIQSLSLGFGLLCCCAHWPCSCPGPSLLWGWRCPQGSWKLQGGLPLYYLHPWWGLIAHHSRKPELPPPLSFSPSTLCSIAAVVHGFIFPPSLSSPSFSLFLPRVSASRLYQDGVAASRVSAGLAAFTGSVASSAPGQVIARGPLPCHCRGKVKTTAQA